MPWGFAAALIALPAAAQTTGNYLPPEILQHGAATDSSLFRLGMFDLNPHVSLSSIYDDNISLRSKNEQDDYIVVFSPGFDILKSRTEEASIFDTRLTYNPALVWFTQNDKYSSADHFVHWMGDVKLARLNVSVSQDYESSAGGVVDVGARVGQEYYSSALRVGYDISEKTSAEINGSYRIRNYEERLIDSTEWMEDNAVHYQITSKVRLGFGVSVGQLDVDAARDAAGGTPANTQTFVTPSLRAAYRTSEKTDVALSAGGEWRSYDDGSDHFGPVFSLTGTYRPWDDTTLSIEAHRREQNSAVLRGQDYIATGLSLSGTKVFRDRYRLKLQLSYDNADYRRVTSKSAAVDRQDDYLILRSGVDAILTKTWSVGIFHQYRINDSTSAYNFENQQIGLQTVWAY